MSAKLSLDSLKKLLREDEEKQCEAKPIHGSNHKLTLALENVWRHVGIVPGSEAPKWSRPMSDTLYRCPLSTPQTTLVPWKALPVAVQTKLRASGAVLPRSVPQSVEHHGIHDTSEGIVEVPLDYLGGDEQDESSGKHRKLQGNLSDKISQFTRGLEGQRTQPFRPGGLEADDVRPAKIDPYRTPEMVERSKKVLLQGSAASWKDKSLLTAPPGMPFRVGLSYSDLHGTTEEPDDDMNMNRDMAVGDHSPVLHSDDNRSMLTSPAMSQGIFSRNYFDDDSLFGSSTSGSDDEDDDAECDDNAEASLDRNSSSVIRTTAASFGPSSFPDLVPDEGENIDDLLMDLTISDEKLYRKKDDNIVISNPLELSEKHLQMRSDATRKLWASEKLLPIVDFNTLIPNPAYRFPFTLDDFQQQAIARLERSESVFVAAHTSAGKTVVAEYAIALAKQRATRCVYTSPIKALSNQKFRDFALKFGKENVGLMTGDLQINVDTSTVLVMTTEILRSMLYRGADLIRDIEFVVFDEVHYVNDTERGVVWEEVIVLLPNNVTMIFLSATTPNSFEFSDWIGRTKQKSVHVIKTDYRPVPLSHFLWTGGTKQIHKVLQGKGSFIAKGYSDAAKALLPSSATDPSKKKGEQKGRPQTGSKDLAWQAQGNKQQWRSLVNYLDRELLTPAVVFSFSKKKCEELAYGLVSLDLNTAKEASAVQGFTLQAIARLSRNDAQLPQVISICEMVKRGIGVHHGGLLPILKEMVEILFSRNLIKVLFATETFAMGVNMPAKAVVFNSIRKHDGVQFRILEPGEYTQMAGRAGRRGLDKVGTVILCCFGETPPPLSMLQNMLTGSSTRLNSNFRLKYGMMLSLLKGESELSVEAMIKRSFSEFATQRALTANEYPQLLVRGMRTLEKLDDQFHKDASNWIGATDICDYFAVCNEMLSTISTTVSMVRDVDAPSFDEIFPPGRLVLVSAPRSIGVVKGPAVVLRPPSSVRLEAATREGHIICVVLLPLSFSPAPASEKQTQISTGNVGYVGYAEQRYYTIRAVDLSQVLLIGGKKFKIDVGTFWKEDTGRHMLDQQRLATGSFPSQVTTDPFAGMKAFGKKNSDSRSTPVVSRTNAVDETVGHLLDAERAEAHDGVAALALHAFLKRGSSIVEYRKLCDHIDHLTHRMRSFTSHRHPNLEKFYTSVERKEALRAKVETLRHLLSNESLHLFPDFLQRKAVLLKLGYIEENETVRVKGRVACEVNTCDELLLTEMVFEGLLNELEPAELIAVLSSLVWQEKSKDEEFDSELPEKLVSCCNQMKAIATNLGQLQKEIGLSIDPGEYCDSVLRFGLVHVVYEWALGVTFKNICELTDAHEGSIVRCITRLDELCREVRNVARVLGNPTLYKTAEAASACIKRDIVFASSLYVS